MNGKNRKWAVFTALCLAYMPSSYAQYQLSVFGPELMERYGLPRHDYYHWCGPNGGGYVLEVDRDSWHRDHMLTLTEEVQYVRSDDETTQEGRKEA